MKIYISDVSGFFSEEGLKALLPLVSETRRKKAEKFLRTEDKIRCIYAEILLRKVHSDMPEDGFLVDENGKPYITGGTPFSISHSGKYVAVMVGEGGIDIQEIKPVSDGTVKRVCSNAETEFLSAAEDKTDAFYKLWTLKEAVAKATGTGLKNPAEIECADKKGIRKSVDMGDKQMYLSVFNVGDYKLAVCGETAAKGYETVVELTEIAITDFDKMFEIMEKSFPTDERRPKDEQRRLFENPPYKVYCVKEKEVKAFMAVWEFDSFVFLEHFAVSPEYRNEGLGSSMLAELMRKYNKKICLEVEPPETDVAKGRIGFYERNGFYLNEYPYIQPPISKGKQPVPLMIMTSGAATDKEEFEEIKNTLYKEVYKTNGSF